MFAYILIAIELAIIYLVFWYVFIREPKPYRISGPLWGVYDSKINCQENEDRVDVKTAQNSQDCLYEADRKPKSRVTTLKLVENTPKKPTRKSA
jgi:hypothetical protein